MDQVQLQTYVKAYQKTQSGILIEKITAALGPAIKSVERRYAHCFQSEREVVIIAERAVLEAILKYNPERHKAFVTFAQWMILMDVTQELDRRHKPPKRAA